MTLSSTTDAATAQPFPADNAHRRWAAEVLETVRALAPDVQQLVFSPCAAEPLRLQIDVITTDGRRVSWTAALPEPLEYTTRSNLMFSVLVSQIVRRLRSREDVDRLLNDYDH